MNLSYQGYDADKREHQTSAKVSCKGMFSTLPTEILLDILEAIDSPLALLNLILASARAWRIFNQYNHSIKFGLSHLPEEIQYLSDESVEVSIRKMDGVGYKRNGAMHEFLRRRYSKKHKYFDKNPLQVLKIIGPIYDAVEAFLPVFLSTRCPDETIHIPFFSSEVHRLRRALWRYHIYCLLFKNLPNLKHSDLIFYRGQSLTNEEVLAPEQYMFLACLYPWEVEELRCAYDFLYDTVLGPGEWGCYSSWKTYHMSLGIVWMQKRHEGLIMPASDRETDWYNSDTATSTKYMFFFPRALRVLKHPSSMRVPCCLARIHQSNEESQWWADSPKLNKPNGAWRQWYPNGLIRHDGVTNRPKSRKLGWPIWDEARLRQMEAPTNEWSYQNEGPL
ncbi:hypothetical protein MMC14_001391 [Varicellaria rhodocarpa]|nr:hypothetical protein [Varicellaria rhodocarpa]